MIAQLSGMPGSGPAQLPDASHHMIFHPAVFPPEFVPGVLQRPGPRQNVFHRLRKLQPILSHNAAYLLRTAAVRIGEAGSDHILAAPYHIGKDDGVRLLCFQESGQLSSLDRRQLLSDQIDLRNIRPAAKQLSRRLLNIRKRKPLFRQLQKRRTAAG